MTEPIYVPTVLAHARSYLGIHEDSSVKPPVQGREIKSFQKAVDGVAKGQNWCMCFALFCVLKAGEQLQLTSWLPLNSFCLTVWNKAPKEARLSKPQAGCIVVYEFGQTIEGHAGIVESVSEDGLTMTTIEGNTTDSATPAIERVGDGVYRKVRPIGGVGNMHVKGFLLPFDPIPLATVVA